MMTSTRTKESLKRNFIKPAVTAGIAAFLLKQEPKIGSFTIARGAPLIGNTVLSPIQYGALLGFTSSFIVESINNLVHVVDKKNRTKHFTSFVTHSLGSMAAWAIIPMVLSGGTMVPQAQLYPLLKVGWLSEMGAQVFHESFIEEGSHGFY